MMTKFDNRDNSNDTWLGPDSLIGWAWLVEYADLFRWLREPD